MSSCCVPLLLKTLDDKDYPDYFELQTAVKKAVASGGASVVQTPSNPVVQVCVSTKATTFRGQHTLLHMCRRLGRLSSKYHHSSAYKLLDMCTVTSSVTMVAGQQQASAATNESTLANAAIAGDH
jgi:hypothetical protein